ncbi:enolase C-terminal domain-like protein [Marinactinospora thermotolerans]|uniref:O-succinylbenzoate synthase n=1 Tax=Marinactinospora thermotolerans DSM 45154 TaxID=1122192 RepID=A0A1T4M7T8_9ACTN|nr:enolase C-terminal domain-like protein [Marinactinospora thermotolerans]SJZ63100.1 O-succinylbenzoate synthase [Marinactinospora thermotolerans DSM 45154]
MSRTEPATLTRVATIDATLLRLPLVQPKPRNRGVGERPRYADHVLVRVADASGVTGWGEIPGSAGWRALVEEFAPALLRHSWQRPTDVEHAWAGLPADPAVRCGLDVACWDLWSRQRDTPLSHALGGTRTAVTAGVTLARQPSLEALVHEVNRQVGSGFKRIRLEIEPGWDIEVVRAVQAAFPYLALQVDAGGRYSEDPDHLATLRALDDYGLLAVEQPFASDDLAAHARLRRDLRTPVAIRCPAGSLDRLDEAIRTEAASALHLSMSAMGGLTPARRAHDRAVDAGWQVWCGSDHETGVGRAAIVALASLRGVTLPTEMPGAGGRFSRDVVTPPVRAHDGIVPVPLTRPGLGHEVDPGAIRAMAVTSLTLTG